MTMTKVAYKLVTYKKRVSNYSDITVCILKMNLTFSFNAK